jgi:DNA repair photolyase
MNIPNNNHSISGGEKSGVAEWAPFSYNVGLGCSYNCVYCYARGCALRFRRVKTPLSWAKETLKESMPRIRKYEGQVMTPSAHDLSPFYLPVFRTQAKALLQAGNDLLIVSKPCFESISQLCVDLASYKAQIIFRFTISSLDRKLTGFWEPGAPVPAERVACLQHAFRRGFATSVSMEPLLAGIEDALTTFHKLSPFVTETIWLGKMNHLNRWGLAKPEIAVACRYIRQLQCDTAILELVRRLRDQPRVRWKDSIRKVIGHDYHA